MLPIARSLVEPRDQLPNTNAASKPRFCAGGRGLGGGCGPRRQLAISSESHGNRFLSFAISACSSCEHKSSRPCLLEEGTVRAARLFGAWSEDSYELGVLTAATAGTAAVCNGLGVSVDLSLGLLFVVACEIDGGAV
jgi:hypothetical protein